MKLLKYLIPLLGLITLVTVARGQPASVSRSVTFSHTASYDVTDDTLQHVDSAFFAGVIEPFDAGLGALESFTIIWNIDNTLSGSLGASGGYVESSAGGTLQLGGIVYDVATGGGSRGGAPFSAFSFAVPVYAERTFLAAGAGNTYDGGIYDAITGTSPVSVAFLSAINLTVGGNALFDVTTNGTATLIYNFSPSAVPEPASFAGLLGGFALLGAWVRRPRRIG